MLSISVSFWFELNTNTLNSILDSMKKISKKKKADSILSSYLHIRTYPAVTANNRSFNTAFVTHLWAFPKHTMWSNLKRSPTPMSTIMTLKWCYPAQWPTLSHNFKKTPQELMLIWPSIVLVCEKFDLQLFLIQVLLRDGWCYFAQRRNTLTNG